MQLLESSRWHTIAYTTPKADGMVDFNSPTITRIGWTPRLWCCMLGIRTALKEDLTLLLLNWCKGLYPISTGRVNATSARLSHFGCMQVSTRQPPAQLNSSAARSCPTNNSPTPLQWIVPGYINRIDKHMHRGEEGQGWANWLINQPFWVVSCHTICQHSSLYPVHFSSCSPRPLPWYKMCSHVIRLRSLCYDSASASIPLHLRVRMYRELA